MAALGHAELTLWKKELCTLGGKGGFTNEYRMYNGELARPLFVRNVDNGSQGAVSLHSPNCWRAQNPVGNQPGIHLPWSGMEIWPASLPDFFLRRWSYWITREFMVSLFSNLHFLFILFERFQKHRVVVLPSKLRIKTFPSPLLSFTLKEHYTAVDIGVIRSLGRDCVYIPRSTEVLLPLYSWGKSPRVFALACRACLVAPPVLSEKPIWVFILRFPPPAWRSPHGDSGDMHSFSLCKSGPSTGIMQVIVLSQGCFRSDIQQPELWGPLQFPPKPT